jgi:hypothetical protein
MLKRALFFLLTAAIASVAAAATVTEHIDRTFDAKSGAAFSLINTNGTITVHTWDQPRIRVQADKKVESGDDAAAKSGMKDLQVDFLSRNGGLAIGTRYPDEGNGLWALFGGSHVNASVTFDVTVPRSMSVTIENTNGALHLADIRGTMKLETTNGKIEVLRCAGHLDAETTNGSIRAELTSVDAGQPMQFETTNGRISIALPATYGARVDASTSNGGIRTELPVATTAVDRNSLRGTINGGGAELKLRTTNGSIEITTLK